MQTEIKRYVICLKYGDKYSADYVNKLYNMVQRHLSLDYEFYCITENSTGLDPSIKVLPLNLNPNIDIGWWYKINLFDPKFPLKGTILFLDLDVVIFNSIDKFFTEYSNSDFCISRGFRKDNKTGMNSSCFRLNTNTNNYVYDNFIANSNNIMKRLNGDQDWLQEQIKEFSFWPDNWLLSYKWNMVTNSEELLYTDKTSIAVFHGKPNPHELNTKWIKQNWR